MRTRDSALALAAGWGLRRARELVELRRSPSVPPRRLRARTGASGARAFVEGGRVAALELADALALAGSSFADARAVLDFGCGSGRVLAHVAALASDARCSGCDVDAAAITWAARHLPEQDWLLCGFEPPLPFGAEQFDLLYSISVLSHLDEALQDLWLRELNRVLLPGGIALLSVHGPHAYEEFRSGRVRTSWCRPDAFARRTLAVEGFAFEPYLRSLWNEADLPGVGAGYGLAFQHPEYVRRVWSQTLDVVDVVERGITAWQDVVVCRKGR